MAESGEESERDLPGSIGDYRIEGRLGEGGMGLVYRGRAPDGTAAAVKVIRSAISSAEIRRRFEREGRVRIDHPNLVRVLDAGSDDQGTPFIAFELLEGETLGSRLSRGVLSPAEAVAIGVQACRGLDAAHAAGIIHRDLKPTNLFLTSGGTVKILDFGVSLVDAPETRLTQLGGVVGTLAYLSPEQAEGGSAVDHRTDLWSLAAVLYESVAGEPPFRHESSLATVVAILSGDLVSLVSRAPAVPVDLARVIEGGLSKARADRWQSAEAFGVALSRADLSAPTVVAKSAAFPSITPGEQRVVAILLARDVREPGVVSAIIGAHGGTAHAVIGKQVIGVFGGRKTVGDEVARAAAAAMLIRPHADRVAVAVGRAAGTGEGLSGSAIDAAERACEARLRGVAIDTDAARSLSDTFRLTQAGEGLFELGPDAALVSDAGPTTTTDARPVGRTAELAQLERAIDSVLADRTSLLVLVTGPQGIGKSLLRAEAERMIAAGSGWSTVLTGRGESNERERPLGLFASVVRHQISRTPVRAEDVRALLDKTLSDSTVAARCAREFEILLDVPQDTDLLGLSPTDPQLVRDRVRAAISDWLAALASNGPLALLLEDLQWVDRASIELVLELGDRLHDHPVLMVLSGRPEFLEAYRDLFAERDMVHLALRGLGSREVGELAAQTAGEALPDELVRSIYERTAGNPFFVQQIVSALKEEGRLHDPVEMLPLPLTVEAAVQARLDQLPPAEKDACKRAAIFGRPFRVDELEAIGVPTAKAVLRDLNRRDLVSARSLGYQFKSPLVAEVAYRLMADRPRETLHRQVAELLRSREPLDLEELAFHLDRGASPDEAAAFYVSAALRAGGRGDAQAVLRCSDRALTLGIAPSEEFALRMARVDALRFLGRPQDQAADIEAALRCAPGARERAWVLSEQCVVLSRAGRSTEALAAGADAVTAARRANDSDTLVRALGRHFLALLQAGRLPEAAPLLSEATVLASQSGRDTQALVREWQAQHATAIGDLGARLGAFAALVEIHRERGDARRSAGARANLADVHNRIGAYRQAAAALGEALEDCIRVGHRTMEGYVRLNLGYALMMIGEPDKALGSLELAATIAVKTNEARLAVLTTVYQARCHRMAGRADRALALATTAVASANEHKMPGIVVAGRCVAAQALLALGRHTDALGQSRLALEGRDELGGLEEDEIDVFITHVRSLEVNARQGEAQQIRRRAVERLDQIASGISDPSLRERFVRDVPSHREVLGWESNG